jgi:hypothetical protein
MLRLVELALFLAPFVIFFVWRIVSTGGGPSARFVLVTACVLIVLVATLIWLRRYEALPPGTAYAPATLQDGQIVSGHPVPR